MLRSLRSALAAAARTLDVCPSLTIARAKYGGSGFEFTSGIAFVAKHTGPSGRVVDPFHRLQANVSLAVFGRVRPSDQTAIQSGG